MSPQNNSNALTITVGDLWRWIVTSLGLFMLIAMPIAYGMEFVDGATPPAFKLLSAVAAAGIAAFLVWSDSVSWIGE